MDLIVNLAKKEAAGTSNDDKQRFYKEISKYLTKFLARKAYAIKMAQDLGNSLAEVAATTDEEDQTIAINRFIKNSNAAKLNIYQFDIIEEHILSTGADKETLEKAREILLSLHKKYSNEYGLDANGSDAISEGTGDYHQAEKKERLRMSAAQNHRNATLAGQLSGSLKLLIAKLNNTPTAENMIGVTNMDATFASILANPKYAGEVINNAELNKEFFAGFSKEFQDVFMSMHINMRVEKYDDEIEVYFEYGTKENGENAKVKFLDNTKGTNTIYVVNVAEFGKVLAQETDSSKIIQQLREKNDVIEKITIQEDGNISFNPT